MADDSILSSLRAVPVPDRHRSLESWLCARVAEFLLREREDIDPQLNFIDLGFDSLRAVDFKDLLQDRLSVPLRTTILFDYPTVGALSEFLLDDVLFLSDRPEEGVQAQPAADVPGAPAAQASDAGNEDLSEEELRERLRFYAAKLRTIESAAREPIAIVGMACRFPGGANTPEEFWELLREGRDAIVEVPAERWPVDRLYDPDPAVPGKMNTRYGGFINDVDLFDATFFGISPKEALQLDPQQRLLLETTWEALENAGQSPQALAATPTGVFIGTRGSEYFDSQCDRGPLDGNQYYATGNAASTSAGRISYTLGLIGPCMAIDTACSASLVALHVACQSLRQDECSSAIAGGVNLVVDAVGSISLAKANMLSPDGRCKAFDASANGYVRAEGVGVVYLKRLSTAVADGDNIIALVRGTGINQDGASGGLTVPHGPSQVAVIRQALNNGGVAPGEVEYVEAHGTGTSLGDPIELQSLDEVFGSSRDRDHPLRVGSVKTNIGHLEPAAGISGLFKLVLALQHEAIPPHLHLNQPSSHIPWSELNLQVPTKLEPWKKGSAPRRGGVSSFGFSGTNAHVVVEEAPPSDLGHTNIHPAELILLSAVDDRALQDLHQRWMDTTSLQEGNLADIAHTSRVGRASLAKRRALVVNDLSDLRTQLAEEDALSVQRAAGGVGAPSTAFLFSGQGAQYPKMGRELYEHFPVFKKTIDRCALGLMADRGTDLREVLWGESVTLLSRTDWTQPALFAVEAALFDLWESCGIRPSWLLGHSVGEYAAAYAAGVFSLEDGLRLIAGRGRLMVDLCETGSMAAMAASQAEVEERLANYRGRLEIAAINGPRQIVVSGEHAAVDTLLERLSRDEVRATKLQVSHAFHSPLMDPMLDEFRKLAQSIPLNSPSKGFISNLRSAPVTSELADPDYWVRHVREPVRFHEGMTRLAASEVELSIECGPNPVLVGMARAADLANDMSWGHSLSQREASVSSFLTAVGVAWCLGWPLRAEGLAAGRRCHKAVLPTYPFQRQSYWLERGRGGNWQESQDRWSHPLVGTRVKTVAVDHDRCVFESRWSTSRPAWLNDHQVFDQAVVPGAAWIEVMLAAGQRVLERSGDATQAGVSEWQLKDVAIEAPLMLTHEAIHIQSLAEREASGAWKIQVFSQRLESDLVASESTGRAEEWLRHASATFAKAEAGEAQSVDLHSPLAGLEAQELDLEDFYEAYATVGIHYGDAFRALTKLQRTDSLAVATLELPGGVDAASGYLLSPVLLDAAFQAIGAVVSPTGFSETWLPVGMDSIHVDRPGALPTKAVLQLSPAEPGQQSLSVDGLLVDASETTVARFKNLRLIRADRSAMAGGQERLRRLLHTIQWQVMPEVPVEEQKAAEAQRYLVVGEAGLRDSLEALLRSHQQVVQAAAFSDLGAALLGDAETFPQNLVLCAAQTDAGSSAQDRCSTVLKALQALIQSPKPQGQKTRVILLTRGAQPHPAQSLVDPDGAALWGMAGTLMLEAPDLGTLLVDLDPADGGDSNEALAKVIAPWLLVAASTPENRIVWRKDLAFVPRLVRGLASGESGDDQYQRLARLEGPQALRVSKYGSLSHLTLVPTPRSAIQAGEVRVEMQASALNFKDVLYALGMLKEWSLAAGIHDALALPLGFEGAGVITEVATDQGRWKIGDEVIVSGEGCLSTDVVASEDALVSKPADLSFTEAAALPTVFVTAVHALLELAQLSKGERILIHAGAGGVGQAAVQIAQGLGAEVYATASPSKWDFLKAQGVKHVMHSRNLDFADEIMRLTEGEGVDVVLNSLNGDFIPKSLQIVAGAGRFIEIGKVGAWTEEAVLTQRPDIDYFTFDLQDIMLEDPAVLTRHLSHFAEGYAEGRYRALPTTVFELEDAQRAFSYLAQAKNIGKVVLEMAAKEGVDARESALKGFAEAKSIRSEGSYLITGGLGALGMIAAERLIQCGAKSLVLVARSEPMPDVFARIEGWRDQEVAVDVQQLSVTDREGVAELIARCASEGRPIVGVIHAAGVLADAMLINQDRERFAKVFAPKVDGLRIMDEELSHQKLDFFVNYASMTSLLGAQGQAPYAAANAWMDAYAWRRRAEGCPMISIDWGPWAGGGMAAGTVSRNQVRFAEMGLTALSPEMGADALELLWFEESPQVGVLPIRWSRFLRQYQQGVPPLLEAFVKQGAQAGSDQSPDAGAVLEALRALPADDRPGHLGRVLEQQLAQVLGFAASTRLDPTRSFGDLGVDSLLAVDMKNRLESALKLSLPATLLFDHPSLQQLVEVLIPMLDLSEGSVDESSGSTPSAVPVVEEGQELLDLSEAELAERLAQQIDTMKSRTDPN